MKRSGTVTAVMAALGVFLGTLVGGPAPGTAAAATTPVQRVMVMGDSITHGAAGDWTWRYRLWKHLEAVGPAGAVDLVGPAEDVRQGTLAYVDDAFDRAHAARWGNRVAWPMDGLLPGELAATYQPDVVVILLGVNDLVWLQLSPAEVAKHMARTIADLRAAAPGVDVVVTRIPLVNVPGVERTNARYSTLAADLDDETERVVVAEADAGFVPSTPTRVEDTYNALHPTSRGELKIAAAVADALAELGIGAPYPRPLPQLPLGPRTGAVLEAEGGDESAQLRWVSAAGTTGEIAWVRDLTVGSRWVRRSDVVRGGSVTVTGLRNGHSYEVAVKPVKVWARAADTWSNRVVVTPSAAVPPTPRRLTGRAVDHGVRLDWRDVRAATSYVVSFRVVGTEEDWRTREVAESSVRLRRLTAGAVYAFRVNAVDDGTAGGMSRPIRLEPTGPRPAAPELVRAAAPRPDLIRLRWTTVRRATHYAVWVRNVSTESRWRRLELPEPLTETSVLVPGLDERTTYELKVRSWHQLVRGGVSSPRQVRTPSA